MRRLRVFAVDDNPDTLELIRMTLEDEYDMFTCEEPTAVPEILEIVEPDVIILDVMMPKLSGYDLIDHIKNTQYRNVPVIFLTAKGAVSDQKRGYTLGASLYLVKPFQPSRLVRNLEIMGRDIVPGAKRFPLAEATQRLEAVLHPPKPAAAKPVAPKPKSPRMPPVKLEDELDDKTWLD